MAGLQVIDYTYRYRFSKIDIPVYRFLFVFLALWLQASCDSGALSYTEQSVAPETIATFSSADVQTCFTVPGEVDSDALPPAQFAGIGQAAVGHSGPFEVAALGGGHKVDTMHTAIKFDLAGSGIPVDAFNETLSATLVFVYNLTERSEANSSCRVPISEVRIATAGWDDSSNFYSPLPSRPFTTIGCTLISGSRVNGAYSCLVSEAVIDWMRDPAANPNHGFVINPPDRTFDSCGSNIGEPGNRVECVSEISSVGLNVEYLTR